IQIDVVENQLVVKRHAKVVQANQLFGHLSSPVRKKMYLFSLSNRGLHGAHVAASPPSLYYVR
ncbi:MAG: hypothetical protein IJS55_01880, partial [Oscillospiraceae bacterium]|nr:hypothetical protein [Oscillospiraceae bacterium]